MDVARLGGASRQLPPPAATMPSLVPFFFRLGLAFFFPFAAFFIIFFAAFAISSSRERAKEFRSDARASL
jgi:hypothetical protein